MSRTDAEKWDARHSEASDADAAPVSFLRESVSRLGSGSALVLAAGRGRNAVYLAECGFEVTALDISEVGLAGCRELAQSRGVKLETVCADLDAAELGESRYDLITKIYYYQPELFPAIRRALMPGGYFFFYTFSTRHAEVGTFGPRNPDYRADRETVLEVFAADTIIYCDEVVLTEEENTEAVLRLIVRKGSE